MDNESPTKLVDQYQHTPLPSEDCVRLLSLHAGSSDDRIRIQLDSFLLERAPPYEALSYVWGTLIFSVEIDCDGRNLLLTESLYQALKHLRYADRDRRLWIDQICINQSDIPERESQVQMMGTIYSQSSKAVVFLGPDPRGEAENAFAFVRAMYGSVCRQLNIQDKNNLREIVHKLTEASIYGVRVPSVNSVYLLALNSMFSRDWFGRLWIVQEAMLPENVDVLWGLMSARWLDLCITAVCISDKPLQHLCEDYTEDFPNLCGELRRGGGIDRAIALFYIWRLLKPENGSIYKPTITSLMHLTVGQFRVTEQRDRLFAMLGMCKEGGSEGLPMKSLRPDYSRPIEDIIGDFVIETIKVSGKLEALCLGSRPVELGTDLGSAHPSWIPSLTSEPYMSISSIEQVEGRETSARGLTSYQATVQRMPEATLLSLKGFRVAKVRKVTECFPTYKESFQRWMSLLESAPQTILGKPFWKAVGDRYDYRVGKDILTTHESQAAVLLYCFTAGRHVQFKLEKSQSSYAGAMYELARSDPDIAPSTLESLKEAAEKGDGGASLWFVARTYTGNRRIFSTDGNHLGLGPPGMRPDDLVCMLFGGPVPFVIRAIENGQYRFVGECFVQGIMTGEVYSVFDHGHIEAETFVLC